MPIRPATPADIPVLLMLLTESPTAARWSESQFSELFAEGSSRRTCLVAEVGQVPSGFLIARGVGSEWELENIVVAENARSSGLGRRLIQELINCASRAKATAIFLEVRVSNLAARKLYETIGFHAVGRRVRYYSNPLEDAVVYRLDNP